MRRAHPGGALIKFRSGGDSSQRAALLLVCMISARAVITGVTGAVYRGAMTISALIEELQAIHKIRGDVNVMAYSLGVDGFESQLEDATCREGRNGLAAIVIIEGAD